MKALTVQQPWAWAIIHGGKDVENRTQAWTYRGPLAIHAGARMSDRGLESKLIHEAAQRVDPERPVVINQLGRVWRLEEGLVRGAIIGVVNLVSVHLAEHDCCDSPWAEASYVDHPTNRVRRDIAHLVLEHPRPLADPVPCRGALGLWTVPIEIKAQVELHLGAQEWVDEIRAEGR